MAGKVADKRTELECSQREEHAACRQTRSLCFHLPVKIELKANASIVVEMIALSYELALPLLLTHIVSTFGLNDIDENVKERDSLDHHGSISTWKDTASERKDELRDNAPR
jgi:hypothetical protein